MKPTLTLIAAVNKNRVIGKDNQLLYDIPEDMAFFKEVTTGGIVIMGRNTFDSIGRPLPKRINVIITSKEVNIESGIKHDGAFIYNDLRTAIDECLAKAMLLKLPTVFVIGGAQIYEACMVMADRLILTEIDDDSEGDAYFPNYPSSVWTEVGRSDLMRSEHNKDAPPFQFVTYER